jgi:dethiobiotin synthetase
MTDALDFPEGLLVTGTDTGVGKTIVAAGLVAWLNARGVIARGWKPVESGTEENGGRPVDAWLLHAAAGGSPDEELPVMYPLPAVMAPVLAARREGVALVPVVLDAGFRAAAAKATVLVVEGVGGALVEVAEGLMVADLPRRWQLPVLIVAANRLGVLSHALLTVEALQSRGADVLGVVLNTMHAGAPTVAEEANAAELQRLLPGGVPLLAEVPWIPDEERHETGSLAVAVEALAFALCDRGR